MNKEFIPYDEALALRELGFDEIVIAGYMKEDKSLYTFELEPGDNPNENWGRLGKVPWEEYSIPAPLYQQALRWFRENHGTNELIFSDGYQWTWDIRMIDKEDIMQYPSRVYPENERLRVMSNTYQEAEIACLRKLIEIVKLKKN